MKPRYILLYCADYDVRNDLRMVFELRLRRSIIRPVVHEAACVAEIQRHMQRSSCGVMVLFRSFDGAQLGEDARVEELIQKEPEEIRNRFKIYDSSHSRVEMMAEIRALFFEDFKRGPLPGQREAVSA